MFAANKLYAPTTLLLLSKNLKYGINTVRLVFAVHCLLHLILTMTKAYVSIKTCLCFYTSKQLKLLISTDTWLRGNKNWPKIDQWINSPRPGDGLALRWLEVFFSGWLNRHFAPKVHLAYGQSGAFSSDATDSFLRKLSRDGPLRPRGSSGGMNLLQKKKARCN